MNIRTWIKYSEPYLPTQRCRKLRYLEKSEFVELELEEISGTSLKPAFETEAMIYSYEEKLWKEATVWYFHCTDSNTPMTALQVLLYTHQESSRYFKWDETKEQVVERAKRDLKSYLLVDAVLYVQVDEPMYQITTYGFGHNHGGTGFLIESEYCRNLPWYSYFNALEYEKAMDYAIQTARNRGDTDSTALFEKGRKEEYMKIKVFDKSLVTRNPKVEHGNGDPVLNKLEDIVRSSDNCVEAAVLCVAAVTQK